MKVECPRCGFHREVDADQFEGRETVIANCPRCGCRFRFSVKKGVLGEVPPNEPRPVARPAPSPASDEEEEDIRLVAKRAYEREAMRFAPGRSDGGEEESEADKLIGAAINPWAYAPGEAGWFSAFFQTASRIMFSAYVFFKNLPKDDQKRAFFFYLVVCVVQAAMEILWSSVFYNFFSERLADDPQVAALLKGLRPGDNFALDLTARVGSLILQLYIYSLLIYLMYRLVAPGRGGFPLIFQIMAYSSAPALLCVIPAIGSIAGMFWSLGCLAYGCKVALDLDWPRTLAGFAPLIFLYGLIFMKFPGLGAS